MERKNEVSGMNLGSRLQYNLRLSIPALESTGR
jgi:hypothetical protein